MVLKQPSYGFSDPSPWVRRFAPLVPKGGCVLDVACGSGRHCRFFLARGHPVVGVDRDISALADLVGRARFEAIEADLEDGSLWPFKGKRFAGVVVTNYLYRPLLSAIVASVAPGGVLIYETFAEGNERFLRPRSPEHLVKRGELRRLVEGRLRLIAYEHGQVSRPWPAIVQRICAVRDAPAGARRNPQ